MNSSGSNHLKPQFFSAYYDDRVTTPGHQTVLVLGYHPKAMEVILYCVITFSNRTSLCLSQPATATMIKGNRYISNKLSDPMSYSCRLGCGSDCTKNNIPVFVALSSSSKCTASSKNIPVHNLPSTPPKLNDFGVCVQTPVFGRSAQSAQKIAEFIEMNRVLGAKQFTIYVIDMDKQVLRFLQRQYSLPGLLQIVRWRDVGHLYYHGELLAMHDCLYRNMKQVKYLVYVDLDELILPMRHLNWLDMVAELENNTRSAAFIFLNTYFTRNRRQGLKVQPPCKEMTLPRYFHWSRRLLCKYHTFRRSKFIVKPDRVIDLDIHGVHPLPGYSQYTVPESIGVNAHYRYRKSLDCTNVQTVVDTTALKFQPQVMKELEQKICVHSS